jgi:hypothetical protein
MTATTIPLAKLPAAETTALIDQYELVTADAGAKRYNANGATRLQKRINMIVDLIGDRADDGDPIALAWFEIR